MIRPLNVLTVGAERVEAQAAFRQAQGERILKLHKAGSIVVRINRLYVKDYGNLRDFECRPDLHAQTSEVLGRNGAGKSNLIEALGF